jgi:enediyne biosynthesis protein E4
MGVDFADVNEDGRLDIFVSNLTSNFGFHESNFLFLSQGNPGDLSAYRDASRPLGVAQSGWSWDARFADFDNDTHAEITVATGLWKGQINRWPDFGEIGLANDRVVHDVRWWPALRESTDMSGHEPNRFFVRGSGARYVDMAAEVGLGSHVVSRGLATADIEGDGDLDLMMANQWEPSTLYRNECARCGSSLILNLRHRRVGAVGAEPGRVPAVGATAAVTLPDGRRLIGEVDGGWGHSGKRSPELHFGLGDVPSGIPLIVTISWRDLRGVPHAHTIQLPPGRHDLTLDDLTTALSPEG